MGPDPLLPAKQCFMRTALTTLNGSDSEWESLLTQHIAAPAIITVLLPPPSSYIIGIIKALSTAGKGELAKV